MSHSMPFLRLTGLLTRSPRIAWASLIAAALFLCATATTAAPSPNVPVPREPAALAVALETTTNDLTEAISHWRPKSRAAPADVVLLALYELRRVATDFLTAHRELYRLTPPIRARAIKVGPARPAAELLDDYRDAERRFSVPWNVLAAVNFVETKFGKLRSSSAAGAQGPMQFMPGTWRRYGLGGNVHDAHDAILGAANYLHASGAPRDLRLALHHYNPSSSYVDAVLRYARRIGADRTRFFGLYNWQVFVKTPGGDRRVTGPGIP
jgi:membrane-bound lytic murein transglycosylase B